MQPFPHRYAVAVTAAPEGDVLVREDAAGQLATDAPPEFGGPGGRWSPETLFVAAAADCLALTFRAMAVASKLVWLRLGCDAEGTVERVDGETRFTSLRLRAHLTVPPETNVDRAKRLVEKASRGCLVTSSLAFEPTLEASVTVGA
jgi:organic hydroperoxide reductase OsmC/OhrA